jgi:3-oxoacyl-[acyl-carrier protein] reductase
MIDLSDHHVMVVGGSRGIGAATARMAASAGAAVSLTYRQHGDDAFAIVKDIEQAGGRASAYSADAADTEAMVRVFDEAVAALGPLTGLVVSAGIYADTWLPIDTLTPEDWDLVMAVNLRGTFTSVQAAAPHLRTAGGGSVVIYTSTAGQSGAGGNSAYATSKGAQIAFMRSAASELAPDRIRVNCIAPAWTETETATALIDKFGREAIQARCPLGRTGLPDDIAGPTCVLLSDLASYITGSTLTVDGGQAMRG